MTLRRLAFVAGCFWAVPAAAQVDQQKATAYFAEAAALCAREGGRLWGVSLCGPMVLADAPTQTIATNQTAPTAPRPRILGYANSAIEWGGTRWATYVWSMLPADDAHARGRLMLHELFHRIQPQLGLFISDRPNDHLDTVEGRIWMQLEWRALAKALGASGADRAAALRDALAFRLKRRALFPDAAENERLLEIQEGLAQYTGTVASTSTVAEATADVIAQLAKAPEQETLVRTFAYPSGAAYGILLEAWSPGWTRRIKSTDDVGAMIMAAARIEQPPTEAAETAAHLYGGAELRVVEEQRETGRQARLAELRRRFVEGPVLVVPGGGTASFTTSGMTPIPGLGTVYPTYRISNNWGSLEAAFVLVASDWSKLTLPAPPSVELTEGRTLKGDGWTLVLAAGWVVRPGSRAGDFEVVRGP